MEPIYKNLCGIYVVDYHKYPGHGVGIPNSPTVGAFRRDAREYIHVSSTAASMRQTVLNWGHQPHILAICLDSKN